MRRSRPPRTPLHRFAIISTALCTLLLGYYLGNRYQLGELRNSAAIMLEQPIETDTTPLPRELRELIEVQHKWVILLPGEAGTACDDLLRHYVEVVNRLAAWPEIQSRVSLALLDITGRAPSLAWQNVAWAASHPMREIDMLALTETLGIAPVGNRWCRDVQATAALLGPGNRAYALLPLDNPADIAESLRLIITNLDPDA